jgi:uncharacterized membrane protein YgdD (TMEM256/DUF423 family)
VSGWDRLLVGLAGLAGGCGVAAAAAAAHLTGGGSLETASRFLLVHAASLLGLASLLAQGALHRGLGRAAAWSMALGLVLFCGDLSLRALVQQPLAPMAAPAGGVILIGAWLLVAAAALRPRA